MKKLFTIFVLLLCSVFAKAQTFTWNGFMPIFDLQTDTVPIVVSGLPSVIDNSFGIGHACVTITHTYDNDLSITLMSPNGSLVTLLQNMGGSNDNFIGSCMGMDGTAFTNLIAPYTGLFVPVGNLASMNNGQNPNGTWKLIVTDLANADTGSIHEVNIEFTNNPPGGGSVGGPTGIAVCATCVCPGGATDCDLLPDMTSSYKEINLNHSETPGFLDISNATPNIGYGPIEIYGMDSCFCGTTHVPCGTVCPNGDDIQHVVKQRIYHKSPGQDTLSFYDRFAGMMTYHATHGHIHVDNWAQYTLRVATSNPDPKTWPIIGTGTKQSFCLINLGSCSSNPGECVDNNGNTILTVPNNGVGFHTGCGLNQGIYPGQYDVYSMGLNEPIVLNNVCNGTYYIVSITDPDNNFLESDETNNTVAVPITLTQQSPAPSITASGSTTICPGDSVTLNASIAPNYLWSTGATTQSIVVNMSGSYTVSSTCGSSVSTSSPVVVTVTSSNVTPTVSISITAGSNPMCLAATVTLTATSTFPGATPVYQWKVDGVNVGTNSPTYTSSYTNGQVVTCVMTSSLSCVTTSTVTSNAITMLVSSNVCYCIPAYGTSGNSGCLDGDVIAHVVLNTLDNLSGAGCPSGIAGYSDYSASSNPLHTTTLQAGNNYTCTVTAGQYGEGYALWIDFNDDGVFSTTEKVGNTTSTVAGSGSVGVIGSSRAIPISISCTAPAGQHRMRVRCIYNLAGPTIDPCINQSNWGEAEDYTITISSPVACPKPTAQTATAITSNSATLGWTIGCSETLWNVHVTNAGGGAPSGAPSNPGVGNPFNRTGLNPNTAYEFWVAADCSPAGNGTSLWTGPFAFTTLTSCSGTLPGSSFANPIIIGQAPCSTAAYTNTQTNSTANCFTNNYSGANNQASPDIWYQFTLASSATVQVSHCTGTVLSDSYLHILNSAGTQLFFNDDNGPLCTGLKASISATLAAGTYYVVSEGYNTGVGAITTTINTTVVCPTFTVVNLNAFIEGYYMGGGQMRAVLFLNGMNANATAFDSITVELHNSTAPFATVSSEKSLLNTNGSAVVNFPASVLNQNLYIVIKHRNTLETWSANPLLIQNNMTYSFALNVSMAYGSNLYNLGDGNFALWSGDVNQDGIVESTDFSAIENDAQNFLSGYIVTDITGDALVESADYSLLENNLQLFLLLTRP
ncbi:MAG: proprotein convertase P-domain-containing protein [Bacteroidetes bacterium]|nr:proprotein convertase P-domain-containing protein [Bacteroidota bacterium]